MAFRKKSEITGKLGAAAGVVKEKLGRATGSGRLEEQGVADRTAGNFEAGTGRIGRKVENAVRDAKKDIEKL